MSEAREELSTGCWSGTSGSLVPADDGGMSVCMFPKPGVHGLYLCIH